MALTDDVSPIAHPTEVSARPTSRESRPSRTGTPVESQPQPVGSAEGVLVDVGEAPSQPNESRLSGLIEDDLDEELAEMIMRVAAPGNSTSAVSRHRRGQGLARQDHVNLTRSYVLPTGQRRRAVSTGSSRKAGQI